MLPRSGGVSPAPVFLHCKRAAGPCWPAWNLHAQERARRLRSQDPPRVTCNLRFASKFGRSPLPRAVMTGSNRSARLPRGREKGALRADSHRGRAPATVTGTATERRPAPQGWQWVKEVSTCGRMSQQFLQALRRAHSSRDGGAIRESGREGPQVCRVVGCLTSPGGD